MAYLDSLYKFATRLMPSPGKFFYKGYGNMDSAMAVRSQVVKQIASSEPMQPANIEWESTTEWEVNLKKNRPGGKEQQKLWIVCKAAKFDSPASEWLPSSSKKVFFQFLTVKDVTTHKRIAIHLPTTGDQFYWLRTRVAEQLAADGVASIILMFPFYGPRRPEGQTAHFFGTVADFAVAVSSALLEAAAVAAWVRQAYPQADICFTGVSMGGTVAAAAALLASPHGTARGPAVVPCVGTWSAETFVRGVLRKRIAWEALAIDSHEGPSEQQPTSRARRSPGSHDEDAAVDKLAGVLRDFSLANLLDACHEANNTPPQLGAVVQVSAKDDAFIPAQDAMTLHETLGRVLCTDSGPARIVWEEGGHLSSSMEAFGLRSGGIYVKAILDAFAVLEHREPPPEQPPSSGNDSSPSIAPTHV